MKRKLQVLLIIILLLSPTVPARAQSPVTAQVNRTSLSTDDTLELTIVVTGASLTVPRPTLPALTGFDVVGSSSSSQISIVNTKMTAQGVYRYQLRPTQTGKLVIEPVSVTIDGQTYQTQPITIQVSRGSGQPAPGQATPAPAPGNLSGRDFFVEAEVDNPTPYQGRQIIYTFRFYQAVNLLDSPRYDAPDFTGFWNQQEADQSQYQTEANGRTYRVTELHTLLFPTVAGEVTIEPAMLTIPNSIFQQGGKLQTEPVVVTVRPLPPNAPSGFNGAVGNFSLQARLKNAQGKVNEPLTLLVTLSGEGNITNLPDPVWPEPDGWRAFESKATTNTEFSGGILSGSREYERLLVPAYAGDFTIPAVSYTYFNPADEAYHTITTRPLTVSIAPAEDETPPPVILGNKETVRRLGSDIRHIKPVPPVLQAGRAPLTGRPLYRLVWGILPALAAFGAVWRRRQTYRQKNSAQTKKLQARKCALNALAAAEKRGQSACATAEQVLNTYLGDKFNRPVSGLTQTGLADFLAGQALPPELIARIQNILTESQTGRFSPAASRPEHGRHLLETLKALINDLEKES